MYFESSAYNSKGPCTTYPSDMRVKVSPTGLYTYTDVSVVCGEALFEVDQEQALHGLDIEVERGDYGEQSVVLVHVDRAVVRLHLRPRRHAERACEEQRPGSYDGAGPECRHSREASGFARYKLPVHIGNRG
jgi:hypothetical protein